MLLECLSEFHIDLRCLIKQNNISPLDQNVTLALVDHEAQYKYGFKPVGTVTDDVTGSSCICT